MLGELKLDGTAMDPEVEQDAMDGFFGMLGPIVEEYEGTIEDSIGDDFVVLFGVPIAHEDDAARALRAARRVSMRRWRRTAAEDR